MNLDEIKQILDMVREHELDEFELEQDGVKLRLRKNGTAQMVAPAVAAPVVVPAATLGTVASTVVAPVTALPAAATPSEAPAAPDESLELAVVTSPIVGTFYRSPEPSAPSFVEIGQAVRKGQVLCIIEAMKLMNEIESEYEGTLVKVYVENGQPVQYGERLFAIQTR